MRRKRAIKAAALLMSASLLIGSLPTISGLGMGRKVSAAEEEMSGFATKEQLLADYSRSKGPKSKVWTEWKGRCSELVCCRKRSGHKGWIGVVCSDTIERTAVSDFSKAESV